MKTLIIAGTAKSINGNKIKYNVSLFGQSPACPVCVFITGFDLVCDGYTDLQEHSRAAYAKYFNTDLFNIISLDCINMI